MIVAMIGHKGLPAKAGGVERHVEELSTALVRLGVSVISFDRAWYVGSASPIAGIARRFSHGIRSKHLDAITHTLTALVLARKEKPDVIHIHSVGPSLLLPIARILHPRARLVATFHSPDRLHAKWGRFAQFALRVGEWVICRFADRTIAVSDALAAHCLNMYQCQPAVIPNGVKVPAVPPADVVGRLGLIPGQYFLMATRLVAHKNIHVAMEAHRLLAERRPDLATAFPLVIAGGSAWTDVYARELRTAATGLPFVRMVGERLGDELVALQAYATCHLSVSSSEGMSIALLEGMALGRPVIVSDIPENAEVVGDLAPRVPAGDAAALSDALECVATMTETDRNAAGAALRARTCASHDWNRIAAQTLGVYQELLENARQVSVQIATS